MFVQVAYLGHYSPLKPNSIKHILIASAQTEMVNIFQYICCRCSIGRQRRSSGATCWADSFISPWWTCCSHVYAHIIYVCLCILEKHEFVTSDWAACLLACIWGLLVKACSFVRSRYRARRQMGIKITIDYTHALPGRRAQRIRFFTMFGGHLPAWNDGAADCCWNTMRNNSHLMRRTIRVVTRCS